MIQRIPPETADTVCRNLIATYGAVIDVIKNPPKGGIGVVEKVIMQDLLKDIQHAKQYANGYRERLEAIEGEVRYALNSGRDTQYKIVSSDPVISLPPQEVANAVQAAVIKIDRMVNLPPDKTFVDETKIYRPEIDRAEAQRALSATIRSIDRLLKFE